MLPELGLVQRTPQAGHVQGEHVQGGQLHGKGLGAGYGDFRPRVGVDYRVALPGDGGALHVDHRHHRRALEPGQAQGGHRIGGLPGLGHQNHRVPASAMGSR